MKSSMPARASARAATVTPSSLSRKKRGAISATITGATANGIISPDVVTVDYSAASAAFADKNVGLNKSVSASGFTLS
ncbi:MAG: YDG domain-containing protein, partial [Candidatus Geothermincolales bacterium]